MTTRATGRTRDTSGCRERRCFCHDDSAGPMRVACTGCGCRPLAPGPFVIWRLYHVDEAWEKIDPQPGPISNRRLTAMLAAACPGARPVVAEAGRAAKDHSKRHRCPCGKPAQWYCPEQYQGRFYTDGWINDVDPFPIPGGEKGSDDETD
jgi:hypothetical protein